MHRGPHSNVTNERVREAVSFPSAKNFASDATEDEDDTTMKSEGVKFLLWPAISLLSRATFLCLT